MLKEVVMTEDIRKAKLRLARDEEGECACRERGDVVMVRAYQERIVVAKVLVHMAEQTEVAERMAAGLRAAWR